MTKLLMLIVLIAICISQITAFNLNTGLRLRNTLKLRAELDGNEYDLDDGAMEETEEEMRERFRKKARKMMYNENGVAYAPWVSKQIDEEAIIEMLIKKEQGASFEPTKTSILDRGEIEAAEGMRWRMDNNQVDLAWGTGGETENLGFIVEKRPSYGGDFQEIASFQEVSQLKSKGSAGGRYRYTDPSTAAGSWIYRIQDCDAEGNKNTLCQCFVEVQTEKEQTQQLGVAAALGAFFVAAAAVGYALNPPIDY